MVDVDAYVNVGNFTQASCADTKRNLLQLYRTVKKPKVFIVLNTTSRQVGPTDADKRLEKAARLLELEKNEVCKFLAEQGYVIEEDSIIVNHTKQEIIKKIRQIVGNMDDNPVPGFSQYDCLMMWFIGIESDDNNEIIYVDDSALNIDTIYEVFKSHPCIDKFIGKPKLFYFLKLQGIERVIEHMAAPEVPMRLPVDADFWTCLVNLPFPSEERDEAVISLITDFARSHDQLDLDDLMYDFKARFKAKWSDSSLLPITSSTLRHDVTLSKSEAPTAQVKDQMTAEESELIMGIESFNPTI